MKIIILPGYSLHNKDWAYEILRGLKMKLKTDLVMVHEWQHWQEGNFSLKEEVERILKKVNFDKVDIIAKSVGTLVAIKLLERLKDRVRKLILCGIPSTSEVRKKIYSKALKNFQVENILCIQNTNDPFSSYQEVLNFFREINPKIEVREKPGSDHNYPYLEDFWKFLKN